ncbi:MAG: hypothetical protein ABI461_17165, partial [Polyangiaceae bacterium]
RLCEFVADRVRASAPHRWLQGAHKPAFACDVTAPAVVLFSTTRLRNVPEDVAHGLVEAAHGRRPLHVLDSAPTPNELLAMQARGERCVSILSGDRHPDPLEFALHDLCHLEKFVDQESYAGQVGFFAAVHHGGVSARFSHLDEKWKKDVEHVVADMNGSPVFLFAALKMKLKMAARREVARVRNTPENVGGVLDSDEEKMFEALLDTLFDAIEFPAEGRRAGRAVSAKRDAPADALWLARYFTTLGEQALSGSRHSNPAGHPSSAA